MQEFALPYGHEEVQITIDDKNPIDLILPFQADPLADPVAEVTQALLHPLDFSLQDLNRDANGHGTVAIAINDKTRPVPHATLLPPLLEWLHQIGYKQEDISFIVATGTHIPMPPAEFPLILPDEIINNYRIISHDCDDSGSLESLGKTSAGTTVFINRQFMQAGLRIVVGDIEPHHFMGFSGGVKTAAIGLAGRETIRQNHAFITHPNAVTACYDENPMRRDVEEIGDKIGVHLALNAILNEHKGIVRILTGHPRSVIRQGIPLVRKLSLVPVPRQYDFIIASAGGHPKDINFYQAQKGLTHAAMLCRRGGTTLLVAACPEGAGNRRYEAWMEGKTSHEQVLADFSSTPFEIGMHKAYLVSRIAAQKTVLVYSGLPASTSSRLLLNSVGDLQRCINSILASLPPGTRTAIMPQAVITIPDLPESQR